MTDSLRLRNALPGALRSLQAQLPGEYQGMHTNRAERSTQYDSPLWPDGRHEVPSAVVAERPGLRPNVVVAHVGTTVPRLGAETVAVAVHVPSALKVGLKPEDVYETLKASFQADGLRVEQARYWGKRLSLYELTLLEL